MRLFPFENDNIFVETSRELNLSERAKLMMIIREYNMDTDLIKNPKQKLSTDKKNYDVLRQARNFDMTSLHIKGNVINIEDLETIEIKSKKNEPDEIFDIRDLL